MIHVLEPRDELLKQFVASIYILTKGSGTLEFTAYPTIHTPVALLRDAHLRAESQHVYVERSGTPGYMAVACNQFLSDAHLHYLHLVDEIAINFKPLGFASFTRSRPQAAKLSVFHEWDDLLPNLFNSVFAAGTPGKQLQYIEVLLLQQYQPLENEAVLLKALALLNDTANECKMQEIAAAVGMHYKQFYRLFTENIGCSPAHYRKLVKFRSSVESKVRKGNTTRLVDICYDNDYSDQSYFIRQFKELTGESPARFFKDITSFGDDKVIFKLD